MSGVSIENEGDVFFSSDQTKEAVRYYEQDFIIKCWRLKNFENIQQ